MVVEASWYVDVSDPVDLGIMVQFEYIKQLEEVMLPYAEEEMPLQWVFQQENNMKHTSKHLGFRPTWLRLGIGQPNPQILIH